MRVPYSQLKRTSSIPTGIVTTADMKKFLRVTHSEEDTFIDSLIQAAMLHLEQWTGRSFLTQTWEVTFDSLPSSSMIWLPRSNVLTVTSVKYLDGDLVEQTLATANYNVVTGPQGGIYIRELPTTGTHPEAFKVTYTAGFGATASDVPDDILTTIKMIVEQFYKNRDGMTSDGQLGTKIPDWILLLASDHKLQVI